MLKKVWAEKNVEFHPWYVLSQYLAAFTCYLQELVLKISSVSHIQESRIGRLVALTLSISAIVVSWLTPYVEQIKPSS